MMVMKTLPDPTNEFLLKFAGLAMWLGEKIKGCSGFLKGTAKVRGWMVVINFSVPLMRV